VVLIEGSRKGDGCDKCAFTSGVVDVVAMSGKRNGTARGMI
jgi:hypothetical protein